MKPWFAILAISALLLAAPAAVRAAAQVSVVAPFNAAAGEMPDGLALASDGNLYVGLASSGEIRKVTPAGAVSSLGALPSAAANALVLDPSGRSLYVALTTSDAATHGIWRVNTVNGTAERFVALSLDTTPGGLTFRGEDLFVSDSTGGRILKVTSARTVTVWATGDLLEGEPGTVFGGSPCWCPAGDSRSELASRTGIGATGIAFRQALPLTGVGVSRGSGATREYLYVANADAGAIVRIPVQADGSAGTAEILYQNRELLGSADGIAFDSAGSGGNLLVAVGSESRIVSITPAPNPRAQSIATGGVLQNPASLVFTQETLYVTNSAFSNLQSPGLGAAQPALLRITATNSTERSTRRAG